MNPLQKRIMDVLTADVNKWEKAAEDVETMIPKMPEPDREHWIATATVYRSHATEYKSIVEQLKSQRDV
jgi:CTP synthase (UTP-ammonia lyase)